MYGPWVAVSEGLVFLPRYIADPCSLAEGKRKINTRERDESGVCTLVILHQTFTKGEGVTSWRFPVARLNWIVRIIQERDGKWRARKKKDPHCLSFVVARA
jgi:hypothetical protein